MSVSREDLAQLVPSTACEMTINEFLQPTEINLTYFDSTFYVVPNRTSDRGYGVLFQALAHTGLAAVAQITLYSRESVVILRACGCRMIAQTLFYDAEIRREREYRAETSAVSTKELDLALRLIEDLRVPFEPLKYFDRYRDGLQRLVRTRVAAQIRPRPVKMNLQAQRRNASVRGIAAQPTADSWELTCGRKQIGK